MKDFISLPIKKNKNDELSEEKIFHIPPSIIKDLESGSNLGNLHLEKLSKEDLANLIYYVRSNSKGKFNVKNNIDIIKYFLNKYTKYGKHEGDKDFLLSKLGMTMHIEKFPKDYLLFRKDDIGDQFYIILKGSVSIVIIQEIMIEMSQEEYNIHIKRLKFYKEYQLLDTILSYDNKLEIDSDLLEMIKEEIYLDTLQKRRIADKSNFKQKEGEHDINPDKFVQRVVPFVDKRTNAIRMEVKIPIYKIVVNLTSGDTFGEVALSKVEVEERKRTATVITDKECIFGIVPNASYSTFLKEIEEKARYNLVSQLVSHSLFKGVLPESFIKWNYLNYFNIITFRGGTYLFKQGEPKTSLFFVTDGNIDLYTETSIHNIISIIQHLKEELTLGMNIDINDIQQDLENDLDIIREYKFHNKANSQFNKFCQIKRIFKIYNINKKETLGFDDCLLKDDIFFTSAKIMSNICQVFVLKINFLDSILKDNVISRNYYRTNFHKKVIMIKRLSSIIRMLINQFLKKNKVSISIQDYSDSKKKNETSILKSANISFEAFKKKNKKIFLTGNNKKLYPLNLKINGKPTIIKDIKSLYIANQKKQWKFNNINEFLFKIHLKNKSIKKSNKIVNFKNKLINIHINFSNDNLFKKNKFILPVTEKYQFLERLKRKKNKENEKLKTEIDKFSSEDDIKAIQINKIIQKIPLLSSKLMFDEYYCNKKRIKNMPQSDFIFYEHFFTNQGKKHY